MSGTTYKWKLNNIDTDDDTYSNTYMNLLMNSRTSSVLTEIVGGQYYEIKSSDDIAYIDLTSLHDGNASYTLDFTVKDNDPFSDENINYLTFGWHTRARNTGSITIGKKNRKPVIGIITESSTAKATPEQQQVT